jgi:thioredoxin-related protein
MIHDLPRQSPGARAPGDYVELLRRIVFLCALLLAAAVLAKDPDTRDPRAHFFAQTFGDLPEEMEVAKSEGKLGMLLFFEAEDCQYCQAMLRNVFSDRRVQDWYRERFINIAIDIHGDVEITDFDGITLPSKVFSDHRKIYLTPVVAFLDLTGAEIQRQLGMVRTPEEFLILGEYIEGKHYLDTEYEVFASKRGRHDNDAVLVTPAGESE